MSNCYLVEEGGKLILVDAGTPGDWPLLNQTLASLGRALNDLEAVLLTHAHSDHTGFAERARAEVGSKVFVHEADADVARGGKPGKRDGGMLSYLRHLEMYRTILILSRRGGIRVIPITELSTFKDGDRLDLPSHPRVIHAPGHTPGSSALLLEAHSALFSGDGLVTRNPLTGRLGPQVMPSALNADTAQALGSLSRLERTAADLVLPGHGEVWKEGVARAVIEARRAGRS